MALLPARRGGTVDRPGSQAADRWDPTEKPRQIQITGG
jgi:hypothetical protein